MRAWNHAVESSCSCNSTSGSDAIGLQFKAIASLCSTCKEGYSFSIHPADALTEYPALHVHLQSASESIGFVDLEVFNSTNDLAPERDYESR